ncbi:hypothetical protein L3i22_012400 [Actinoplanes sp. L3-i22]|nr:hypothetical protein L3i22_012400 [Actinoplanes sp. L3-i22]
MHFAKPSIWLPLAQHMTNGIISMGPNEPQKKRLPRGRDLFRRPNEKWPYAIEVD